MKLFCLKCNQNHELSLLDVEKLVYGMQAQMNNQTDLEALLDHAQKSENDPECHLQCSAYAEDTEVYYEHIQSLVSSRRKFEGLKECIECGEDEGVCNCLEPDLRTPWP